MKNVVPRSAKERGSQLKRAIADSKEERGTLPSGTFAGGLKSSTLRK
jgi:hypothetical protein